eukprot:3629018-Karenia_brevis.AAC.1
MVLPEYVWDYCFPGDEMGLHWIVLAGKERKTGMIMATTVPQEGGREMFAVDRCLVFIDENGDAKGDTEVE